MKREGQRAEGRRQREGGCESAALRIALDTAAEPILATVRSTTEVNSSNTTSCDSRLSSPFPSALFPLPFKSARARSHRNRSPLLSAQYGLIQLGGLEKPTAVSMAAICLVGASPRQSMTARSAGQGRCS